jgi:hypothetical protein
LGKLGRSSYTMKLIKGVSPSLARSRVTLIIPATPLLWSPRPHGRAPQRCPVSGEISLKGRKPVPGRGAVTSWRGCPHRDCPIALAAVGPALSAAEIVAGPHSCNQRRITPRNNVSLPAKHYGHSSCSLIIRNASKGCLVLMRHCNLLSLQAFGWH